MLYLLKKPLYLACTVLALAFGANASTPKDTSLVTHQAYIHQINQKNTLNLHSTSSVFNYIFNQLPQEVTVYPTENYYYFQFFHNGVPIVGNLRLDALDRDHGIVHFAYFSQYNRWNNELVSQYKKMNQQDGIKLIKKGPLEYRLTFKGKTVTFHLNNLSAVRPPKHKLRQDEQYIGPVYDDSGIQFYLVYNSKVKRFHYILNQEQALPDILTSSQVHDKIYIGTRTGFAYLKDDFVDRLILIGVYEGNSMVNNYFDGPFDQLPDNFIKGDALKKAFIDQRPYLKGKIDRFGNTGSGDSRVLISPYIHYGSEYELTVFTDCTDYAGPNKNAYYACLKQVDPNFQSEEL